MKKIIFLLSVCLFCISGIFAQWDDIPVTWTVSGQCDCNGSIDSVFKVVLIIDDIANEVYDILDEDNENWESGASSSSMFPAEKIEYYCNEINHENTPSFMLYAYVYMYCENPTQVLVCDGRKSEGTDSCLDFSNGNSGVSGVLVSP